MRRGISFAPERVQYSLTSLILVAAFAFILGSILGEVWALVLGVVCGVMALVVMISAYSVTGQVPITFNLVLALMVMVVALGGFFVASVYPLAILRVDIPQPDRHMIWLLALTIAAVVVLVGIFALYGRRAFRRGRRRG
jgi:hypothetical protein